jgi:hypothetical protein
MVHEDERHHGFGNWGGTDTDTGIVTAIGLNLNGFPLFID